MTKLPAIPELSWTRWTLLEAFAMVNCAAVASYCVAEGQLSLGVCFLSTAISARVAMVDYSFAGVLANGLVLLFGIPTILLTLWWAIIG